MSAGPGRRGAPVVAVVDYGMGNRRSVEKALARAGARAVVTADHAVLAAADGLVVPGVGAFPRAMESLRARGLDDALRALAADGTPVLGVCLGMQLLFESSQEHGGAAGLGLLAGTVTPLQAGAGRLPHIGWSRVRFTRVSPLLDGLGREAAFYHVHSYVCRPADASDVVGESEHGERFASVVQRGAVAGVQFHPEKSSAAGLRLLRNFAEACARPLAAASAA